MPQIVARAVVSHNCLRLVRTDVTFWNCHPHVERNPEREGCNENPLFTFVWASSKMLKSERGLNLKTDWQVIFDPDEWEMEQLGDGYLDEFVLPL